MQTSAAPNPISIERSIELLERTPSVLRSLLQDLPAHWTTATEGPGTWSPYDVVGHLVHAERVAWIARAELILSDREDKTFPPLDRFAQFEESKGKTMHQLLDDFDAHRSANLNALRQLPSGEALQRTGVHPQFGNVTLAQLLATWTVHDLDHINQIVRVLAKQYGEAVGPWKANLRILR
ncbi:DinB family protein [Flaviaesturariibacter aridisoli]|uniref:DinB family protein n=1 Tax=Flaviaesturariibacter aridisoli TaxID=2545761 RepID=A0A4R4E0L2_9BACT|nr:DinB family protein [Flaviaesturariibacter aridisoli]TCZ72909.1 DinB family protein [Flaviaesturariibacter aridisoli]